MIEKVKAGKILGNISPFLKLYHPNIDRPAEETFFYFIPLENFLTG
jgi:hypothetical protein